MRILDFIAHIKSFEANSFQLYKYRELNLDFIIIYHTNQTRYSYFF